MTDAPEKTIAQVAYEAFLAELAKTPDAAEAEHAPPWEAVPHHVRIVIAEAVGAAVRTFAPALVCEVDPEEQSFAQVGYQAYVARTGGLNYQGLPCPVFEALTDTIKAAWGAAATAIRSEHEHRVAGDYDLAVSKEELTELIAGIDALQRSDTHQAEVAFPLRSRLRALLNQAQAALEDANEPFEPIPPGCLEDYLGGGMMPRFGGPPIEGASPATESTSAEPGPPVPPAELPPPVDANAGLVGAAELPSPSKAPPVPELTAEEAIPEPPAPPTEVVAPTEATELDKPSEG